MPDGAADQRVDVRLDVVLLWHQCQLWREPNEAGILPLPKQSSMYATEHAEPAVIHSEDPRARGGRDGR